MSTITYCLREGLNIKPYLKKDFDHKQLLEIAEGLKDNVDVKSYAKPDIPASDMAISRRAHIGNKKVDTYYR